MIRIIYAFICEMYNKALNSIGVFSPWEKTLFEQKTTIRNVIKNEILLQKGEVCSKIYFCLRGSLLQSDPHDDFNPTIIDLHLENEWIVNQSSFVGRQPSSYTISAYTDGVLLELSIESIHELISKSTSFLQLNRVFEKSLSRVAFFDNSYTPLEKYQSILNTRPQLIQVFPLKIIASYLKITPETLSRVREKIIRR
ncbi:Crp/Fnr family transcriptional regulator [Pedobacter sp. AW1-32]|uniref:Crp/Fnr family transcriptional regulator n=1 Tax=Pedobacter sp. AW1-32 TaxID=3383026 RepID=UPI003FF0B877